MDYLKKKLKKVNVKNNENVENKKFSISSKIRKENNLSSPFATHFKSKEENFNEKKIRRRLEEIIPERDYYLIDHIIKDKRYYFHNSLNGEVGVFRDNMGNLLQLVHGGKKGFTIPNYIMEIGTKNGLNIVSHNHINGLVIPSSKDIGSITLVKGKYNIIYSPNKTSLLFNSDISKNKLDKLRIVNKYDNFIKDKEFEIQKLYPEKTVKIKSSYGDNELDKKLNDDLYRSHFAKNQENIAKEINRLFKKNDFDLKLYIL